MFGDVYVMLCPDCNYHKHQRIDSDEFECDGCGKTFEIGEANIELLDEETMLD